MSERPNHIIGICSTRPQNFARQIAAFCPLFQASSHRKILILLVSDLEEDTAFEEQLLTARSMLKDSGCSEAASIVFARFRKQEIFFKKLRSRLALKSPQHAEAIDYFLRDYGSKKLGGIRGIQNKADLLLHCLSSGTRSILHRIDDDIFPVIALRKSDGIRLQPNLAFFNSRESELASSPLRLLGAAYSGDSPSPVVDLFESLSVMLEFFARTKDVIHSADSWTNTAGSVSAGIAEQIHDPLRLTFSHFLPRSGSYEDALQFFSDSFRLTVAGQRSFIIRDSNRHLLQGWYGFREFVPGGCVGHLAWNQAIPPTIPAANQDVLTSHFYHLQGNDVFGDVEVFHSKRSFDRLSIQDEPILGTKHRFGLSFALYNLMQGGHACCSSFVGSGSILHDFFALQDVMIHDCFTKLRELIGLLEEPMRWWGFGRADAITKSLKGELCAVLDREVAILRHFTCRPTEADYLDASEIYGYYQAYQGYWPEIRNEALICFNSDFKGTSFLE